MASIDQYLAVILAAGDGTRMNSSVPKLLHEISGDTVLGHVLRAFEAAGFSRDRIILVLGHAREEVVRRTQGHYAVAVQDELLGTGDAVMRARKLCLEKGFKGNLVVGCGDAPLVRPETIRGLVETHEKSRSRCTVLTGVLADPTGYGRILRSKDGRRVLGIVEEKEARAAQKRIREVNSGMYCFSCPELFDLLKKTDNRNSQKEYYLTDVVRGIIKSSRGRVSGFCAADADEILGVNDRFDLMLAYRAFNRRNVAWHMCRGVSVLDPDTTHIACNVQIGRDTVIFPHTVIEAGVKIGERCHIGPFAHVQGKTELDDDVEIGNFVDVKRSRLGRKTKAKHLAYLGDTVTGERVNIGAGTITANYDGVHKHPTHIADGAFIGSGTVIIAPNRVGAGAVTAAGAVLTKNTNVEPNAVVAGVPARFLKKKDS